MRNYAGKRIITNDSKILVEPDPRSTMLSGLPPVIFRGDMYMHFKQVGHMMEDITSDELARMKIRCPIYWDNDKRMDLIFENYLCACGRLFIFLAQKQPDGILTPDYKKGACPCQVCKNYSEGIGCKL